MRSLFCFLYFIIFSPWAYCQEYSNLINMQETSQTFVYDIKYATSNNFTKTQLYPCAICLLQPEVAEAINKANSYFCEKGYRIVFYDCYRPLSIQKKMWSIMPRATYVANPYERGSIHNRAAAVDISLVTLEGCEVDMGTDYDFFGRAAHIDNFALPKQVLENRKLLQEGMLKFGFQTVRTEWWHFSYKKNWSYPTLDTPLPCD